MKRLEFGAFVVLSAIWGVSFLLTRIAAPILGPLALVTARILIASVALLLYALVMRQQRPALRRSWKAYLVLGLLNSALPPSLEAFAVLHVPTSLVAILLTAVPLLTALAATVALHERLTVAKLVGLLLGLLGVGVLIGWSTLQFTLPVVLAIGATLLAALLYSLAGIFANITFRGTPPLALAIGQELLAGMIMLPLALASPPASTPSLLVVGVVMVLALVMTAGGNLLYFYLLDHVGPTKTQSVAFLIPVFALLASVVFLGEPLTTGTLLGLGMIFVAVGLVLDVRLPMVRPTLPAMVTQRAFAHGGLFLNSAGMLSASRPIRAGSTGSGMVYDRHSIRRHSRERSLCAFNH
jgi:drug/metabolite transporter (DMT)-like permease